MTSQEFSKKDLAKKILELQDIPEDERPDRLHNLVQHETEFLADTFNYLNASMLDARRRIDRSAELWGKEETKRVELKNGGHEEVMNWLWDALEKQEYSQDDAFEPFQDIIAITAASDGLLRVFYSLTEKQQNTWVDVFVELAVSFMVSQPHCIGLVPLLKTIESIDELPRLACRSNVEFPILMHHVEGNLHLSPSLFLDLTERSFIQDPNIQNWNQIVKFFDSYLNEIYQMGGHFRSRFSALGEMLYDKNCATTRQFAKRIVFKDWSQAVFGPYLAESPVEFGAQRSYGLLHNTIFSEQNIRLLEKLANTQPITAAVALGGENV